MGQASGELLTYALTVQRTRTKTVSFIIYVNFDHAWAEHYPVTNLCTVRLSFPPLRVHTTFSYEFSGVDLGLQIGRVL